VILKKQYNRAIKHPLTLLNLGSIYFLEKEYAKAKQMFQKTLALNPRDKRAHLYLAELYELVGELKLRDYHLEKSR
jgi:Tfp pilus assembly protein PilF